MAKNLDKFFDPATLPQKTKVEVDISYFKTVRSKLQISFAIPNDPNKVYEWDYPLADKLLSDSIDSGVEFVIVEKNNYEKKVKELANL